MYNRLFIFLIAFWACNNTLFAQEVTIIKTELVYIFNNANHELTPTKLDIYWIIDRKKDEIRVVKERKVDVIKLQEVDSEDELECGYNTSNYISDHIEVDGFEITYFIEPKSEKLDFLRLMSIAEKEKVFFVADIKNEEILRLWVNCNSSALDKVQ